jgi:uncharacterized Zn finger protein (UPF0148 family)
MSLLERYNLKLKEYENDKDLLYRYITLAAPFIKRYQEENCRRDIFLEYMRIVENDVSSAIDTDFADKHPTLMDNCNHCNSSNTYENDIDGEIVCMDCGTCENYIATRLSYQDEQDISKTSQYSYKRQNHFNEWVQQFQGKETANIPNELIEKLRYELKKQRIEQVSKITHAKVRGLLKKLRQNKYYEHIPYITNILTGVKAPEMPQALEERLRLMFNEIQEPFEQVCPKDRKNFLSYPFVLYKFCELLGEDQYLPYFPLLKSKEKLTQQDVIWKAICKILRYEFIPTV